MTVADLADIRFFADADRLAASVAEWICGRALAADGRFAICCSGGSTPRRLYAALAQPAIAPRFPWTRVHWFWGDERFVPPDHPDSNFRMVRDALLARVDVPPGCIHPIPTIALSPQQSAARYEEMLKAYHGADRLDPNRPLFDLVLLGIGADGHTASLFPGNPALDERARWAVAVVGAKSEARITLTYPPLESCRDAVFLATGAAKRKIVARAQTGDPALPAARVRPVGRLHWFTDREAAPA